MHCDFLSHSPARIFPPFPYQKATGQGGVCPACNGPAVPLRAVGGLTHARPWGMVEAPNHRSRNRRLSLAPQGEKDLSAYSAITHTLAGAVSGGRCAHIGRAQRPGCREAPAAIYGPGSVVALPLSF